MTTPEEENARQFLENAERGDRDGDHSANDALVVRLDSRPDPRSE